MEPFLKQVAAHYYQGGDIRQKCFLFPNRRSLVFFKKYLSEWVRDSGTDIPLPLPKLFTINDFFYRINHAEVTDKLRLLLELYLLYKELNPQAEPLDDFVFWGDVMLADFDDIDKYLVNAEDLLQNVSDFKSMQDSLDYLSENQQKAIRHFLSHFRDARGTLTVNQEGESVKSRFLKLWNMLYPLYRNFNDRLQENGMAYEGRVYRMLADKLRSGTPVADILREEFPDVEGYVFVGLNALNACERLVMKKMRDAGLAQFVWDYVSPQIRDKANKASFFMQQNVEEFPQAFPLESIGHLPEFTVISVPSSVGQAKLAPQILAQTVGSDPVETAFVLPDENLLLPLLNSLPDSQDSVNVTMGYPMSASAIFTFLSTLGQMQLSLRKRADGWFFYHRPVRELFASGLLKTLISEEEAARIRQIKADAKYYIPEADLRGAGPFMDLLFRPVVTDLKAASARQNHDTETYLSQVVAAIGRQLSASGQMLLELDFAKRCHTQLNILQDIDLEVLPATHLRILERILEGISVPFRGEPLQGLQVMGPLETRALDFRNLVILSANEGVFPRRSVSSSFIPPELRKGFGLPTYEFQDAVWAYYFYRMIQRPEKVWLLYDSRTEGLKSGEESRYIKQLEYSFGIPLKKLVATSALMPVKDEPDIPKTEADIRTIRGKELSASVLQSYLSCPAKFYYQAVQDLRTEDEVAESMDAGMVGRAFHKVMQRLYGTQSSFTSRDLDAMQKDKARLKQLVREEVLLQMNSLEVSGRNLVLEEVILDYVQSTLQHDAALLSSPESTGVLRIYGLEKKKYMDFHGFRFKGFIDRIDSYKDGELRIVDYKTGRVEDDEILITDENARDVVDRLFGENNVNRPKIALQLFIYDLLAHADPSFGAFRIVNSIYSTGRFYTEVLPDAPESPEFIRLTTERLKDLLDQIVNPDIPFRRTEDTRTCAFCDFKNICGR